MVVGERKEGARGRNTPDARCCLTRAPVPPQASTSAAAFFSPSHLTEILPILLASHSAHPRLHLLWPTLLALLIPGFKVHKGALSPTGSSIFHVPLRLLLFLPSSLAPFPVIYTPRFLGRLFPAPLVPQQHVPPSLHPPQTSCSHFRPTPYRLLILICSSWLHVSPLPLLPRSPLLHTLPSTPTPSLQRATWLIARGPSRRVKAAIKRSAQGS